MLAADEPYQHLKKGVLATLAGKDRTLNPFYASGFWKVGYGYEKPCFHSGFTAV